MLMWCLAAVSSVWPLVTIRGLWAGTDYLGIGTVDFGRQLALVNSPKQIGSTQLSGEELQVN